MLEGIRLGGNQETEARSLGYQAHTRQIECSLGNEGILEELIIC